MYTGGEFAGGKTFSRMMSTLMVLITYSSGMPVLYIVGAIFFGLTYKVNKLVIIKYYQKTLSLNRVVPQYSMQFLTIVLFIHIIVGCFMLTNPSLFKTESSNGVGFKMPSLPVNPGEELREVTGVPESSPIEGIAEEPPSTSQIIIGKISERIEFFHQQIYLLFVFMLVSSYFAGAFIMRVLRWTFDQIVSMTNMIISLIKGMFLGLINFVKSKFNKAVESGREKVYGPSPQQETELEIVIEKEKEVSRV